MNKLIDPRAAVPKMPEEPGLVSMDDGNVALRAGAVGIRLRAIDTAPKDDAS